MRTLLPAFWVLAACTEAADPSVHRSRPGGPPADDSGLGDTAADTAGDDTAATDDDTGAGELDAEVLPSGSCAFDYADRFGGPPPPPSPQRGPHTRKELVGSGQIAYAEPLPPGHERRKTRSGDLDMPSYDDDMPLFDRAYGWAGTRCFELPQGAVWLDEAGAYDLYRRIAERTTGVPMEVASGVRTVLGVRGAFPGTFTWNGNTPDLFDDTLVLLWRDADGKHVIEVPVNTDTGAHDFGDESSSSLRANRRYHHEGGVHRGSYDALTIGEWGYHTIDDTNGNGHLDSDRNGWLPPHAREDYERVGGGHNIHVASVDGPWEDARVQNWSAGCQTIPGMANWEAFITEAWPGSGEPVNYFLVDARDIDPDAFGPACTPDGTSACAFWVESFPFSDARTTAAAPASAWDGYNCSAADESGAEWVYRFTLDEASTLRVEVESAPGVDVDVHLLDAADPDACLTRDDLEFTYAIEPGRYFLVADTYVSDGVELAGEFELRVTLE